MLRRDVFGLQAILWWILAAELWELVGSRAAVIRAPYVGWAGRLDEERAYSLAVALDELVAWALDDGGMERGSPGFRSAPARSRC